jgi:hypothetical protein
MHGFARLAFWRKPAASTEEELERSASPEPATAHHSKRSATESGAVEDVPVPQAGWFTRLKQTLIRRPNPVQELPADADQVVAPEHPSSKRSDLDATVDAVPEPKPSLLARLKNKLRRSPKPEPLEADVDTPQSSPRQFKATTASSQAEPAADEEAVHLSLIQRVRAVLSNKRVWIPGISVMLIAVIATMTAMLLQSGQEKKQLQIQLVAAQQKLKQANTAQKATLGPGAANPAAPKQAANPVVATASEHPAESQSVGDAGECQISNPKNVSEHLKNCIDSFNAMAN